MIFLPLPVFFHSKKKNQFTTKNNCSQAKSETVWTVRNIDLYSVGCFTKYKKVNTYFDLLLIKAHAALKSFNFGQALNSNTSKARVKIIKRVGEMKTFLDNKHLNK